MDRRVRSRFDPSDVVQEALITADRRLPEYLRERGVAFYPWIRKIAWEHLLKLHEKHVEFRIRSIHREVGQLPLTDESAHRLVDRLAGTLTPPSGGIMREEVRWRVRNAMESLKPHEREVLELLYLEQMKSSEIAAVLGISPTTARTRHFRAIEHLSRLLRESE
jgi:RNA polymerase sigma-70 factor (ECF subfamily)